MFGIRRRKIFWDKKGIPPRTLSVSRLIASKGSVQYAWDNFIVDAKTGRFIESVIISVFLVNGHELCIIGLLT